MNTQDAAIHYGNKLRRKPKTKREDCGCELSATIPITRSINPNCEIHSPTRPPEQPDTTDVQAALDRQKEYTRNLHNDMQSRLIQSRRDNDKRMPQDWELWSRPSLITRIENCEEYITKIESQRDELLAALKSITGVESYAGEVMQIIAKAAIAKCEASNPTT